MERDNRESLDRQRRLRQMRERADDQIDPIDDAIQDLKDYKSSGRMDSTRGRLRSRSINNEIDRLEGEKQKAQDRLDRDSEADRQRGGAGQDASRDTGDGMPTIEERVREAGLYNTTTGRGLDDPTMKERERDAGPIGRDRSTTGIVPSPVPTGETGGQTTGDDGELPDEEEQDDPLGTFGVIICINGNPHSASIYGQIGPKLT